MTNFPIQGGSSCDGEGRGSQVWSGYNTKKRTHIYYGGKEAEERR